MIRFLKNLLGGAKKPVEDREAPAPFVPAVVPPPARSATPAQTPAPTARREPAPAVAAPPAAPAPAPVPAAPPVEVLTLPYSAFLSRLPDAVRQQLAGSATAAALRIPLSLVLQQLPKGKVQVTFAQLRSFSSADARIAASAQDAQLIDLPLGEILSRIDKSHLARKKNQKETEIDRDLPAVFGAGDDIASAIKPTAPIPSQSAAQAQTQTAAPAPLPPSAPIQMQPAPVIPLENTPPIPFSLTPSTPAKSAAPKPAPAAPQADFGSSLGQGGNWTMQGIVRKMTELPGVSGALLATDDGLLIAEQWPGDIKGELVAAFIPQMYARMIQYTKALKLSEPQSVTLLIENRALQVYRAGQNYLAVLGRAGETLPAAELTALAQRLGNI